MITSRTHLIMSFLVYLLLCLSLHACSACLLGVTDKQNNKGINLFCKGLEKEKILKTEIRSSVSPFFSEGMQKQVKQIGKNDETGVHQSRGCPNYIKQKHRKALFKEKEDNKVVGLAGNEILASSSQEVLQEATQREAWKRKARRMLRSKLDDAEETVDSKEDGTVEDTVVMDYAQPHRKPPIHNREP